MSTPSSALETIADDEGGARMWRFPVGVNTLLGETPELARVYVIYEGEDESVVYRFRQAPGGGWQAGEALHSFVHADDGRPVGAGSGGGVAADGYWYLVDLEGPAGSNDRRVWAVFEGGGAGSLSSPAE